MKPKITLFFLIAVSALYIATMSPTVSVGDSGEFIAAADTLALPHAPSYPLFSLLGKCFIRSVPLGNLGYRVNLLSVFAGVGTAALFLSLARSLGLSPWVSFFTALLFAFSGVLWEHSLTSEVFSLNALFAVLTLVFFLRNPLLSAFLFGLGLGNHHTLVFVLPGLLVLYLSQNHWRKLPKDLMSYFLFGLIGFSIYIFLPIRSFRNPPLDWSNPENLSNFFRVVTRADYGSLSLTLGEKLPRSFEAAFQQGVRYVSALVHDLSFLGLPAGIFGWILWAGKDRRLSTAYFIFFLTSGIGFLLLGNLPFDSQSSGILPRFFLLPAIPFMLAVGHFLEWCRGRFKGWIALPILLLSYSCWASFDVTKHFRSDFAAYDYGRNLLKTLPKGGILFMDGGDDTFYTLAYLTLAENLRPDLEVHDRGGLIFKNPYGDDFLRLVKSEKEKRRQQVEESFLGVRPLYYSTFDRSILKGSRLELRGILFEAVPSSASASFRGRDFWEIYSYRGIYETKSRPYRLRALVPLYPFLEGVDLSGLALIRRAAAFGTDILWLKSNIAWELSLRAFALYKGKNDREAEEIYNLVIRTDPEYVSAYVNLGVIRSDRGDLREAESFYRQAIKIDPKYADAYFNLGVLYWKENRWSEVIEMFQKTLRLNPDHPTAKQYLLSARAKIK